MHNLINKIWYTKNLWALLLIPFAAIYQLVHSLLKFYYSIFKQTTFTVPVIVVGNLTVGGTGKTPLVIAIAKKFKDKGLKVGIVSRGYKGTLKTYPYKVSVEDDPVIVGDEPLLLARKTQCSVVIAKKRTTAIDYLIQEEKCNLIISDDGLQHYSMGRSVEIIVIDGQRGLGNGYLLPAGPLRERKKKLHEADLIVVNGFVQSQTTNTYAMDFVPGKITSLLNDTSYDPIEIKHPIEGISAIGNPDKFRETLKKMGLKFSYKSFPDHYNFKFEDLGKSKHSIIMTEKDAVKCQSFATENMYYLPIEADLLPDFWNKLEDLISKYLNNN